MTDRHVFSHFASADAVEPEIAIASRRNRARLVAWQYALLRVEAQGAPRPSSTELALLESHIARSGMGWVYLQLGLVAVAAVAQVIVVLLLLREGFVVPLLVYAALGLLMGVEFYRRIRRDLGPWGQAMRLVLQARDASAAERRELMLKAAALEAGCGEPPPQHR